MPFRKLSHRILFGVCLTVLILIAGAIFTMSDNRTFQLVGGIVVILLLIAVFFAEWFEAHLNEKHVEANPHLLKNDPVGETVKVIRDFRPAGDFAMGFVVLNGSQWRARSFDASLPKAGDAMTVTSRDGLTLNVERYADDDC